MAEQHVEDGYTTPTDTYPAVLSPPNIKEAHRRKRSIKSFRREDDLNRYLAYYVGISLEFLPNSLRMNEQRSRKRSCRRRL